MVVGTIPNSKRTTFADFLSQCYSLSSFNIFLLYLSTTYLGRYWRRVSKPLDLRKAMVIYNFCVSLLNLYICYRLVCHIASADHLYSRKHDSKLVYALYLYWLAKLIELLDTTFMILRHRTRQISFLHVFHHSTMLILSEYAYRICPRTSMAMILAINAFIHIVLYLYYGLSALYPNNPPKWKKLLTQMQITQFLIGIVYGIYGWLYHTFCVYGIMYAFSMLYMFSNFYYQDYIKSKPKQT